MAARFAWLVVAGLIWSGAAGWAGAAERAAAPVLAGDAAKALPAGVEARLKGVLGRFAKERESSFRERLQRERDEMATMMGLSAEAQKALDAPANAAVAASTAEWMAKCEQTLRRVLSRSGVEAISALERTSAAAYVRSKGIECTAPADREEWKESLKQVLTPEQRVAWEKQRGARQARRVRAVGQVMIEELDQQIAFTSKQRELLQPIAERLVQTEPSLFPEEEERFVNYAGTFLALAKKVSEQELAPVLDGLQRGRWKVLGLTGAENGAADGAEGARNARGPAAREEQSDAAAVDGEEVEQTVSKFLEEKCAETRRQLLQKLFLQVEDACRVSALAPETMARLKTAARGATEACLADWKSEKANEVWQELDQGIPELLGQRLLSLQESAPPEEIGTLGEQQPLWKAALERELTQAQRRAWTAELKAREAYRNEAISRMVVAEFDLKTRLTAAQCSELEARVKELVREYGEDVAQCCRWDAPWHLHAYMKFVPVAGIPKKELERILNREQIRKWWDCPEHQVTATFWSEVEETHARRMGGRQ